MMLPVSLVVREMVLDEVNLIIGYFHGSAPEHLELLGVDPTRLPTPVLRTLRRSGRGQRLMAPLSSSIQVARSAEDVFAYVTDPTRFAEWQAG